MLTPSIQGRKRPSNRRLDAAGRADFRVAYAPVYIAGVPWLRTGVWAVSVVGLAMIFVQLV
jgi:uncharacterized MAPEG superfamily protein